MSIMNGISKNDWKEAQELLVKLVQTLSPLVQSPDLQEKISPLEISKKLFIPPKENSAYPPSQHPVRWLPKLLEVQQEVKGWIDSLEEKREEREPAAPSSPILEEEGRGAAPVSPRGVPESSEKRAAPEAPLSRNPGFFSPMESRPPATPQRVVERSIPLIRRPLSEKGSAPVSAKTLPSIAQPAQRAIQEVRSAIYYLATSSNLGDPKALELERALKKIKPLIDQLVQAVEARPETGDPIVQRYNFQPNAAPFSPLLQNPLRSRRKEKKKRDRDQEKDPKEE